MLLKALACDFDGTLASEDEIGGAAREALERARRAGLRLILVTGRTFFELTRVCDCLDVFDAVVAENGAVLYYPGAAMLSDEGPAPPEGLLRELDRRGVAYQVGRIIVGATRDEEPAVHLSCLPHAGKVAATGLALNAVRDLRRRVGRPHWVVLDEAHCSLHRGGVKDGELHIEDRGFCLVTYRPSWLRRRVIEAVDVVISSRTSDPRELAFLASRFLTRAGHGDDATAALAALPPGEFMVLQPDAGGQPTATTFVAASRETAHVRHLGKYADSIVAPDRRFFFRDGHGRTFGAAESLQAFRRMIATIDPDALGHHAGHGDFSRWVVGVFGDERLARQLGKAEARWRRREPVDLRGVIDRLIAARYGDDWQGIGEVGRAPITREAGR